MSCCLSDFLTDSVLSCLGIQVLVFPYRRQGQEGVAPLTPYSAWPGLKAETACGPVNKVLLHISWHIWIDSVT